jgi:PKD repeat protein
MHANRASTFALVVSVVLCLASATAWALTNTLPPGSNFNLNNWYIQFPTSNGVLTCSAGSVDSATTTQLIDGYTNAPYFYTGTDGAMVFWAPINGATTGGSSYPRSELRELIATNNTGVNWIPYGTHILNAQCKVLQVPPTTKEVIIGQIHGYSGDALPTVKVVYDNGKIHGTVKTNSTDDGSDYDFPDVSSGLSNTITYTIELVNGLVSVAINGITNSYNIFQSDPTYTNETQYFKAGDYCQADSCTNPGNAEGALVAFYALTRYDAPSITNQPASQTVSVGSNVTFTVGALGSPPLGYAWLLNNTPINNATNATLTIPNAQLTNAGNYSVAVTDLTGGIVTSSPPAVLTVLPPAPVAGFTASPTNGVAPLNVSFTDTSSNSPASWSWTFGDTGTSTSQDPSHTYATPGTYTVTLIASNAGGSSTNQEINLINVYAPFAWWQLSYFGCTNCAQAQPNADPYGTGMSNTNKFLAAFNPTNPAAYLHVISIATMNTNDINVIYLGANGDSTWSPGIASRTNVLEFTAGEASGSYSNNFVSAGQTNILSGGTGTGIVTNMVDAGGATNTPSRYYRVRVLVP